MRRSARFLIGSLFASTLLLAGFQAPSQAGTVFTTSPKTVLHTVSVPPVPVITAVRAAQHPESRYDRIVFDVSGPVPSYYLTYTNTPISTGTGKPLTVAGRYYIRLLFRPAQAHTTGGLLFPSSKYYGFHQLKSYRVGGDFEGNVSIYLGLQYKTGFRVNELHIPNRVYIDVHY